MTIDDRLRDVARRTRASFEAEEVPELRAPRSRGRVLLACAVLAVVLLGSVALRRAEDPAVLAPRPDVTTTVAPSVPTLPASGDAALLDTGPLSARGGHSVVWTGDEMIVWGGWGDETGRTKLSDGAAYTPGTGRWRAIAAGPLDGRRNAASAWTGTEVIIAGGDGHTDGAAYNPETDTWRRLPDAPFGIGASETLSDEGRAAAGEALIVWNVPSDRVARFDFTNQQWSEYPGPGLGAAFGSLRVVDNVVVALGTTSYRGSPLLAAVTDATASRWTGLPEGRFAVDGDVPATDPEWSGVAGDRLIVWSVGLPDAVVALDPIAGTWTQLGPHALPPCEGAPGPIAAGADFIASSCGETALYDHSNDRWTHIDLGELQFDDGEAVWTGSTVIAWGRTCCYGTGGAEFQPNIAWQYSPSG